MCFSITKSNVYRGQLKKGVFHCEASRKWTCVMPKNIHTKNLHEFKDHQGTNWYGMNTQWIRLILGALTKIHEFYFHNNNNSLWSMIIHKEYENLSHQRRGVARWENEMIERMCQRRMQWTWQVRKAKIANARLIFMKRGLPLITQKGLWICWDLSGIDI